MNKLIIFILLAVTAVSIILFSSDGGATDVATEMGIESIRGDVVEIAGKGMYYKNKYGDYPVYMDDIYDMSDSEVHKSIATFERFFDKTYLEKNVKLVNDEELKSKGITYELASKSTKYFIDIKTGEVLVADLFDIDSDYADEMSSTGFKVIETVIIEDGYGNSMTPINGSFDSGSNVYFYGGGSMKLARRDEISKEITNLDSSTSGLSDVIQVLYVQNTQSTSEMRAAVLKSDGVHLIDLSID
jgi:hypothetical protein